MKKQLSLLMIAAVVLLAGCASNQINKIGTSPNGSEIAIEKATIKYLNQAKAGGYESITSADLKQMIDNNAAMVIIDTMPESAFNKQHIPNARNAELPKDGIENTTDEQKTNLLALLPEDKSTTIVVYCGFVGCSRSHVGATLAKQAGYQNVLRVAGGIVAWQEAGYETTKD